MHIQTLAYPSGSASVTVLAFGAWMKNSACCLTGNIVHWSENHGDLSQADNCIALRRSIQCLLEHYPQKVDAVAHDLHPDFYSTQLAQEIAAELNVPAIPVQHHHAHIATAIAEHGITERVLGLALDGVGLGDDGKAWGGELLLVERGTSRRLGHLSDLQLPGGDLAAREPWRSAASVLHKLGKNDEIEAIYGQDDNTQAAKIVAEMLRKNINCPSSSSAGRWFDAASGALGICHKQSHEAEAAMKLEQFAAERLQQCEVIIPQGMYHIDDDGTLNLSPLIAKLFELRKQFSGANLRYGAALFHMTLVKALGEWLTLAAKRHNVQTIVLGGGCFFNQILRKNLIHSLAQSGFRVFLPQANSCGDAGLALGQAWIARQQIMQTSELSSLCA